MKGLIKNTFQNYYQRAPKFAAADYQEDTINKGPKMALLMKIDWGLITKRKKKSV